MAFENKTIKEIRDMLITALQSEFNHSLRILPKSFIKIFATIIAGIFIILYKQIGWFFLQIFPETAYWNEVKVLGFKIRPLVKWGEMIGVGLPRTKTQWKGKITVDVTNINTPLTAGTQLKSDLTGKIYLVNENKTLENDIEAVEIICEEPGTGGNLQPGDIVNFTKPLGNVKKQTTVESVIKKAIDDEIEPDYRFRVVNRWRMQPQGGALADYRIWGTEVEGVLGIYPYKDVLSPSGVLIFVSGLPSLYPRRIPTAELLIAVGKSCTFDPETGKAKRKPLTAIIDPIGDESYLNVKPVSIIVFDVYIEGLTGIPAFDFSQIIKTQIKDYFLNREPYNRGLSDDNNRTDLVSKNNITSVVDQAAMLSKAEFDNIVMRKSGNITPSYYLGMGELCELGKLYINGVEF